MNKYGALKEWYWHGTSKYSEENLFQYHFVHHKYLADWPGIEPCPVRWEAGDLLPELQHGPGGILKGT
jgi:hypothetical protein